MSDTDAAREQTRWIVTLAIPFLAASAFMAATLSGAGSWLIGAAILCGPGLGLAALSYLALTSDTNGEPATLRAEAEEPGASDQHAVTLRRAA